MYYTHKNSHWRLRPQTIWTAAGRGEKVCKNEGFIKVNLVQHNYMVLPLVTVITCYNSITLYTHIHVDNIEDYGCVDVIYNFDNYS